MRIVIFGLTLSSSWGNGNAAIWRGLCGALARQGHHVTFFEHDQPYYASHRDLTSPDLYQLLLYHDWGEAAPFAGGGGPGRREHCHFLLSRGGRRIGSDSQYTNVEACQKPAGAKSAAP